MTEFNPSQQVWLFCAVMSPSVRLGKVYAVTELQARARVEKFFFGGYFFPNQIYVWPEKLVAKHDADPLIWI